MAREIKFRAWDTKYDRWAYFTLSHLISGDVADIAQRCTNWCEGTGLKDKIGREIYEGDLVKRSFKTDTRKDDVSVVKWGYWNQGVAGLLIGTSDCEVIGNTYESPELLQTKQENK